MGHFQHRMYVESISFRHECIHTLLTVYIMQMGLGKTIQTMGLILSTMNSDNEVQNILQGQHVPSSYTRKLTLIVTPLALIQQWASEIRSKTEDGRIKVLVHHGQSRTKGKRHAV